jgi:heme exporter protein A
LSAEAAIRVENLWKRFGHRRALAGIDLEVAQGAALAVFGPNGAGKSTLLKILATRARPTSGRVAILGQDLSRAAAAVQRSLGAVFHESCLRGDLSLDENLRFYEGLYGLGRRPPAVIALVERLGLAERLGDPLKSFSQGMTRRAAIIRSLIHAPPLWLLDEPFSGLDPSGRVLVEGLMRERRAAGQTIVFVTHDVERGLALADDAVLIERGEVAARGRDATARRLASAGAGGE